MDINNICRCCLAEGDITILKNIWNNTEMTGATRTFAYVLSLHLNVQVKPGDGYPEKICDMCIFQLHRIVTFKAVVGNSQKTVESYLKNNSDIKPDIESTLSSHVDSQIDSNVDPNIDSNVDSNVDSNMDSNIDSNIYSTVDIDSNVDSDVDIKPESDFREETPQIYFCISCDSTFLDSKELSSHCLEKHKSVNSSGRLCKYCYERFNSLKVLEHHRRKHLTPFICNACSEGFTNSTEFETHVESCRWFKYWPSEPREPSADTKSSRKVVCHICGKSYVSTYISIHMSTHGNEYKFKCTLCNKSFKTQGSLGVHIICVHKKEKRHKCLFCDLSFDTSSKRSVHMRKVHFNERNNSCPTCGKKFFASADMKKHMLTHTGEKNFSCDLCKKAYQSKHGLNTHKKNHHV